MHVVYFSSRTYSHETGRTAREDSILVQDLCFPPCCRCCSAAHESEPACGQIGAPRGSFDVVIEALDDIARTGLLQVRLFETVDLVLELALMEKGVSFMNIGNLF